MPSPFPLRLDFGLDRTRTSSCFLRALCRIFSHQREVLSKPFVMSSPEFYGYVPFFAVSCLTFSRATCAHFSFLPVLAIVPWTDVSVFLSFFCGTAHVVYYCSWLSFVTFFKTSKRMYELFLVVQYVKSLLD